MAKWIFTDNIISGIHLEAKEATSTQPHIVQVNFSPFPLQMLGDAVTISEAGMSLFNPQSKYNIPETKSVGPIVQTKPVRKSRTNFPTQGELNVKIKGSEVKANAKRQGPKVDNFTGVLNLINLNRGKDAEPIVITDIKCEWRYTGEKEWKSVDLLEAEKNFSLTPMRNAEWGYYVAINDTTKCVGWFDRSWVGRNQPIRFKFTFEDIEGYTASQIVEYVFNPPIQYEKKDEDIVFLSVDNVEKYDRSILKGSITFNPEYPNSSVFTIENSYTGEDLDGIVFKAINENNFEHQLFTKTDSGVTKTAWALVDVNTNRVYAVKALITNDYSAAMGYFEVPLYGKPTTVTKPNKPATEQVAFPSLTPYEQKQDYVQDDDFDDALIPVTKVTSNTGNVMSLDGNSLAALTTLNDNMKKMSETLAKFESVDRNITRLADSFEQIVGILSNK